MSFLDMSPIGLLARVPWSHCLCGDFADCVARRSPDSIVDRKRKREEKSRLYHINYSDGSEKVIAHCNLQRLSSNLAPSTWCFSTSGLDTLLRLWHHKPRSQKVINASWLERFLSVIHV